MGFEKIKNSKQVKLSDNVRFRCIRCTKCCRNLKGTVIIEPLDAWRMAKHLNMTVADFYETYTEIFFMEHVDFPIFALKTTGKDNACIFLNGKKCSIQEEKPRVCRVYPFWIAPGETPEEFTYNLSTEQMHHPKGSLVKVKKWMQENLTDDERKFLAEDYKALKEIAPLYNAIRAKIPDDTELLRLILLYKYFFFETDEPFFPQFERNCNKLVAELKRMAIYSSVTLGVDCMDDKLRAEISALKEQICGFSEANEGDEWNEQY